MSAPTRPIPWSERAQKLTPGIPKATVALDWAAEWGVYVLKSWAPIELLLTVVQIVGAVSVVIGLISYRKEAEGRRKARHYQAWQVISLAKGTRGDMGRRAALEDLVRDSVALTRVQLDSTWLRGAQLAGMRAEGASLQGATIDSANLGGAQLINASLAGTRLFQSCLVNANLSGADLTNANLAQTDLRGAVFYRTDLDAATLARANLDSALIQGSALRMGVTSQGRPRSTLALNRLARTLSSPLLRNIVGDSAVQSVFVPGPPEEDRERLADLMIDTSRVYHIRPTNLKGASLRYAQVVLSELRRAALDSADVYGASITRSDLRGVSMVGIRNWQDIKSLDGSVFDGDESAPDGFFEFAASRGALIMNPAPGITARTPGVRTAELYLARSAIMSAPAPTVAAVRMLTCPKQ